MHILSCKKKTNDKTIARLQTNSYTMLQLLYVLLYHLCDYKFIPLLMCSCVNVNIIDACIYSACVTTLNVSVHSIVILYTRKMTSIVICWANNASQELGMKPNSIMVLVTVTERGSVAMHACTVHVTIYLKLMRTTRGINTWHHQYVT